MKEINNAATVVACDFAISVTALLQTNDSWAYNIDHGNVNAVVFFLTLRKHLTLSTTIFYYLTSANLHLYGINGNAHRPSSYLDNRTQKCFVNGSLSNTCTLKCGVRKGTILGPLLFLLYINDLPN